MKQSFFVAIAACLYAIGIDAKSHQLKQTINNTTITIYAAPRYDITRATTEAIVNPANSMLAHGGGIARAISNASGPQLQIWSDKQPLHNGERVAVGKAIISPSFDLHKKGIKYIVHTVGPDFRNPVEKKNGKKLLYDAWYNTLVAADKQKIISITFPSISTGIFQCPKEVAATQAHRAISDFLNSHPNTSVHEIVIGLWEDTWEAYETAFCP
jgi:O-acetyl-ADP-ribose deacetylase